MLRKELIKPIIWGIGGALSLLILYFIVMGLGSGSWEFTISELIRLRFWVGALTLGFGTQIGLFFYVKKLVKVGKMEGISATTSTATSTVAMIACCAHHLSDILPLIGLAIFATFLVRYQEWFLALGILSNTLGIIIMLKQIKKVKNES